jgi:tRNA(fMet)-specific endonuclease VapC
VSAVIIDTNIYSAFFRGDAKALSALRAASEIHVPLIVLGELLAGFSVGTRQASNLEKLASFMASPRVEVMKPDEKTARHYADIYATLREQGLPIPTNDLWIAALAKQHRMPLLTFDTHFAAVPGIVIPAIA